MDIGDEHDDNESVYKLGYSVDLGGRITDHETFFGKLGCKTTLTKHALINNSYNSQAEVMLKKYADKYIHKCAIDGANKKEIVIVPKKDIKSLIKYYDVISKKYAGDIENLTDTHKEEISERDEQITDLKHELVLKDRVHENEIDKKNFSISLLEKDIHIKEMEKRHVEMLKDQEIEQLKRTINKLKQSPSKNNLPYEEVNDESDDESGDESSDDENTDDEGSDDESYDDEGSDENSDDDAPHRVSKKHSKIDDYSDESNYDSSDYDSDDD